MKQLVTEQIDSMNRMTRLAMNQERNVSSQPARTAFTIVEMIGTCFILGAILSMTVPMLLVIARERQSTEQRQFALQHVTNLLEATGAKPWNELSEGDLAVPVANADLETVLPGLQRTLAVKIVADEVESKMIVASIRWQNRFGQLVDPIRVTTWVYPQKEER